MEIITYYPGSMGEILQGKLQGMDVLLSCPINLFTKVRVFECNDAIKKYDYKKSNVFMKNILEAWDYKNYYDNLDIDIISNIPIGKGFASSTADLCGVYHSLLKLFKKDFNEQELIRECIKIEPTDSIVFNKLTIFDYKNGIYSKTLGSYKLFYILVFEGNNMVSTIEFNKQVKEPLETVDNLLELVLKGINEDIKYIGEAATESIIKNFKRLSYNIFSEVNRIREKTGGLGIIGAHSGNALGIIYDDERLLNAALKSDCFIKGYKSYGIRTLESIQLWDNNF